MTAKKSTSSPRKSTVAQVRGGGAPRASRSHARWELVKSIVGTLAIFFVIRIFLIEAFRIPSGSMIPTLLVGDWLFVNKLIYGPTVPFLDVRLPGYAEPKRHEVAVFISPPQADQPHNPQPTLVKRIVGVPHDTLFMRNGVLFVNGIAQRPGYVAETPESMGDPNESSPLFAWQQRHALRASRFGEAPAQPTHDHWGPLVVPAGHYFMLGDNRYDSKDSRYWGLVPRANFRGRPMFVYYSWTTDSDKPLPALTAIRWGRIGHRIR